MPETLDLSQFKLPTATTPTAPLNLNNFKLPSQQPTNQSNPLQQAGNAIQGVGNFLGLNSLGKGIAGVAYNTLAPTGLLGPEAKQLVKSVESGNATPEQFKAYADIYTSMPSKGQVVGSALQTGANVLSAGIGSGAATAGGRIASIGLQSAAAGAAQGFGQGLEQKKSVGQSAGQGAITGALTGVMGAGIQGVGELAKYLASSGVPESIVNRTLGVPPKVVAKGNSPAETILAEQGIATKKGLLETSKGIISDTGNQIQDVLKNNTTMIDSAKVIETIKNRLSDVYGLVLSPEEIQQAVDKLPLNELKQNPQVSVSTLNKVRQVIDNQYIGNSKWLGTSTAESITGLKTAANTMRNIVKGTAPETVPLFDRQAAYITTRNALDKTLSKPHVMTQLLEGIGSGLAGIVTSGGMNPGALKDAAISFGLLKAFFSTPAQMGIAQGLKTGGRIAESAAAEGAGKLANIAAQNVAKQAKK